MSKLIPKPDLRKLVSTIQEHTQLAADMLAPLVGIITYNIEQVLRQVVTRSVESGVNLQREASEQDLDELDTPLRPPPSEPPEEEVTRRLPRPPKLPKEAEE